jgi:tRNA(Arg) A34 adenosine deaminase TadA
LVNGDWTKEPYRTSATNRQSRITNHAFVFTADDHRYMARALELAERGLYTTTPNPRVGCVIVRDGAVVGKAGTRKPAGRTPR